MAAVMLMCVRHVGTAEDSQPNGARSHADALRVLRDYVAKWRFAAANRSRRLHGSSSRGRGRTSAARSWMRSSGIKQRRPRAAGRRR